MKDTAETLVNDVLDSQDQLADKRRSTWIGTGRIQTGLYAATKTLRAPDDSAVVTAMVPAVVATLVTARAFTATTAPVTGWLHGGSIHRHAAKLSDLLPRSRTAPTPMSKSWLLIDERSFLSSPLFPV